MYHVYEYMYHGSGVQQPNHVAVHLKLTEHCKLTMLQYKKFF